MVYGCFFGVVNKMFVVVCVCLVLMVLLGFLFCGFKLVSDSFSILCGGRNFGIFGGCVIVDMVVLLRYGFGKDFLWVKMEGGVMW